MPTDRKQLILDTCKRFCNATRLLAQSDQGPKALAFAVTLVLLMLGINGLNVVNSYVGRDFMSAIEHKDLTVFQYKACLYAVVFIASSVVAVFYRFTEERLGILWREQLTWKLTEAYPVSYTHLTLPTIYSV